MVKSSWPRAVKVPCIQFLTPQPDDKGDSKGGMQMRCCFLGQPRQLGMGQQLFRHSCHFNCSHTLYCLASSPKTRQGFTSRLNIELEFL